MWSPPFKVKDPSLGGQVLLRRLAFFFFFWFHLRCITTTFWTGVRIGASLTSSKIQITPRIALSSVVVTLWSFSCAFAIEEVLKDLLSIVHTGFSAPARTWKFTVEKKISDLSLICSCWAPSLREWLSLTTVGSGGVAGALAGGQLSAAACCETAAFQLLLFFWSLFAPYTFPSLCFLIWLPPPPSNTFPLTSSVRHTKILLLLHSKQW